MLILLLAFSNTGCAVFAMSGTGSSPYLLIPLGLGAAYVGERRIKADRGGAVGWTLRILGLILFLLG